MELQSSKKIPLYIIILVIIFILIFVVILASLGSNEKTTVKAAYYKKEAKESLQTKSIYDNSINVSSYAHSKVSDSFIVDIPNTLHINESYIFGGPMQYSTVSVYKKSEDAKESLISTQVFTGNHGFVISSNLNIVNSSYYQIGKKINLENLRYHFIPIKEELENTEFLRIVVNNIGYEDFKVYKCTFNYDLSYKRIEKFKNSINLFGLSEYDIEKVCQEKIKTINIHKTSFRKRMEKNYHFV
jgi:hypothetical protein